MNPNYSKMLEKEIQRLDESGAKPRLLLCSSYVMEYLREHFRITVFYYNPNITAGEEYRYRLAEEKRLIEAYNRQVETQDFGGMNSTVNAERIEILEAPYDPANYLEAVKGYEECPEGGDRCGICFEMRLRKTAEAALKGGYDCFTTTLTISPLLSRTPPDSMRSAEKSAKSMACSFFPRILRRKTDIRDLSSSQNSSTSTDRISADAHFPEKRPKREKRQGQRKPER